MSDVKKEWDAIHNNREWGKWPLTEFMIAMSSVHFTKPEAQVRLLDAGCGNGSCMWWFLSHGFNPDGIDISEKAVERTRTYLTAMGYPEPQLCVGDLLAMPYANSSFDLVSDVCSIQSNPLRDIKLIFKEIYRILKPYAIFFTMFRDAASWLQPESLTTTRLTKEELAATLDPYFAPIFFEHSEWTMHSGAVKISHHFVLARSRKGE